MEHYQASNPSAIWTQQSVSWELLHSCTDLLAFDEGLAKSKTLISF